MPVWARGLVIRADIASLLVSATTAAACACLDPPTPCTTRSMHHSMCAYTIAAIININFVVGNFCDF